jgi:hypothetical protein
LKRAEFEKAWSTLGHCSPLRAGTVARGPIVGHEPFGNALDALRNKSAKNRKSAVKRMSGPGDTGTCHVLFISPTEQDRIEGILLSHKSSPVLVAGDTERFDRRGSLFCGFLTIQLPAACRGRV